MGHMACAQPHCLYKGALYLYLYLLSSSVVMICQMVILGVIYMHNMSCISFLGSNLLAASSANHIMWFLVKIWASSWAWCSFCHWYRNTDNSKCWVWKELLYELVLCTSVWQG